MFSKQCIIFDPNLKNNSVYKMEKRREELAKLKSYTDGIDNELTMVLQSLQWDNKHLLEKPVMVACRYDSNHKMPQDKLEEHEKKCFLQQNGYSKDDQLLPDPLDTEAITLVTLKKEDIEQIIGNAARSDPLFIKGVGCRGAEPMSLERLQSSYSADERRAIHDAVVSAVPSCHDLTDLALLSGNAGTSSKVILSRMEILLELRNMRRRRTKYRVAAKTKNYSDVLRDVIRTQMEHYGVVATENTTEKPNDEQNSQRDTLNDNRPFRHDREDDRYRYDRRREFDRKEITREREDSTERNRDYRRERSNGRRERRDEDRDRRDSQNYSRRYAHASKEDDRYRYDRRREYTRYYDRVEVKREREESRERNANISRDKYAGDHRHDRNDTRRSRQAPQDDNYRHERRSDRIEIKREREESSERNANISRDKYAGDHRHDRNDTRHSRQAPQDDNYRHEHRSDRTEIKREREDSTDRDYNKDRSGRYDEDRRDRRDRNEGRSTDRAIEERNHEHLRKRRHDPDPEHNKEKNKMIRLSDKNNQLKKHRRCHKHRNYHVKTEPGEYENKQHDKERRYYEENRDRHKNVHSDGRSREKPREYKPNDKIYEETNIKPEKEDNATTEDTKSYEKEKTRDYRRKSTNRYRSRSYNESSYDSSSYDSSSSHSRERHRYYDKPSEAVYDPKRVIKKEK